MPELKLNDETVARLKVETGREDYYDLGVHFSFGVRVTATAKTWFTRYVINKKHRRLTLGSFPVIKYQQAVWNATAAQSKAREGVDPQRERQQRRRGMTVGALAAHYLEATKPGTTYRPGDGRRKILGPKTWCQYMTTIKNHVLPSFGDVAVQDVTKRDLYLKQEAIAKKYPGAALNFHRIISNLFTHAEDLEEIRGYSPVYRLPRPAQGNRYRRRALPPEEIRWIWDALERRATSASYALRLLLLTGQRPTEVRTMRWSDVRLPWWKIPVTKNGTPQTVFLGATAQQLLDRLRAEQQPSSDFVFPGQKPNRPVSEYTLETAALRRMYPDWAYWCPHCWRHTFSTWAHGQKIEEYVILAMLNHSRGGTTARYTHQRYMAERERWWTAYDAYIQRCLSGEISTPAGTESCGSPT